MLENSMNLAKDQENKQYNTNHQQIVNMLESDEISNNINVNSLSSKESELTSLRMLNTNRQNKFNNNSQNLNRYKNENEMQDY